MILAGELYTYGAAAREPELEQRYSMSAETYGTSTNGTFSRRSRR
jgi:hypothetical protein